MNKKNMKRAFLSFLMANGMLFSAQAQTLVRDISVSPKGESISFSYQGDIWTSDAKGQNSRRLTIHEGSESLPVWSPDGKQIAFSAARHGNNDVFTIPASGGQSKRLTFFDASDNLTDWTTEGELLFSSSRHFIGNEKEPSFYAIDAKGGTPERILKTNGFEAKLSPNGQFIVFTKGYCRIEREDYRGPANRDIWLYDKTNDKYTQLTSHEGNDFSPAWINNSTIAFISARSGRYNAHQLSIDSKGKVNTSPIALSNFKTFGVRELGVSRNGKTLAVTRANEVFVKNKSDKDFKKVNLNLPTDYREDPYKFTTINNKLGDYEISPNGKSVAVITRGELFVRALDSKKSGAINVSRHAYREQSPVWLNDTTLLFISDRSGIPQVYQAVAAEGQEGALHRALTFTIKQVTSTKNPITSLSIAPNRKQVIFQEVKSDGAKVLSVVNIDAKKGTSNQKVLLEGWNAPSYVQWSPDSRWIAYSSSDLNFNSEVYILPVDLHKKPTNVSMHPRRDSAPVWSADGKKLAFTSIRNNGDSDVWMAWLSQEDWDKTQQDIADELENPKKEKPAIKGDKKTKDKKKKDDKKKTKEVKPLAIDTEAIHERLVQLTSLPGDERSVVFDKKSEKLFYIASNGKGASLNVIKWDGSEAKSLAKISGQAGGMSLSRDGKNLFMINKGTLKAYSLAGKPKAYPTASRMKLDLVKERKQIFEEGWEAINKGFYDPNMHGYNWIGLKKQYKPIALSASTSDDFRYVFNLMLGQLNASHMGMYGSSEQHLNRESTPKLGAGLNSDNVVTHVIKGTPASRKQSKLNVGDQLLAIDGMPIEGNIYQWLNAYKANDRVLLTVKGKDGKKRDVVIRPSRQFSNEIYKEWVTEKRRLTEKYSNGKIGYLHIEAMSWPSFEAFERDLTAATQGKDAVVIDVRNNGGGWITDYLMAVLTVKQHAYTVPRGATDDLQKNHSKFANNYPYGERLPFAAWTKASIALCNEKSYSNAEIFSHAYKNLGIGKLVGKPSFGAVISTGGKGLMDGSFIRMPFRAWYTKATGLNQENEAPATPDILVEYAPDSYNTGKDAQLQRAVEELMKENL